MPSRPLRISVFVIFETYKKITELHNKTNKSGTHHILTLFIYNLFIFSTSLERTGPTGSDCNMILLLKGTGTPAVTQATDKEGGSGIVQKHPSSVEGCGKWSPIPSGWGRNLSPDRKYITQTAGPFVNWPACSARI